MLAQVKSKWPEKLAIVWDAGRKEWAVDETLLKEIKSPDWSGWPEEKNGAGISTSGQIKR